jgi:malonyl-CoA/methylmalonyl-CoA synthetase
MSTTPHIDRLLHHVRHRPDAPAFSMGDAELTFGELGARARRWAGALGALGVAPGDRVACVLGTSLDLIEVVLGAYMAGAIHVPVNTRYGAVEVGHILSDSGAKVLLVEHDAPARGFAADLIEDLPLERVVVRGGAPGAPHESSLDALRGAATPAPGPPPVGDDDPALFIYTSGTTGRSKGVVHTYASIVAGIGALTDLWRFSTDDDLALMLPLFHVHGLGIGVHGTLIQGNRARLFARFDPRAVADAVADGATIFMGVPTMYHRLVAALDASPELGAVLAGARLFTSGSAALSADLFTRFEAHTGHRILERYGMSETMLTLSNPYPPERRRRGTIGFPIEGVQARIVGEDGAEVTEPGVVGALQVRGATLMREYWRAPERTAESFEGDWFRTGDVVTRDADGYVVHRGRASVDILKCGGYKLSAREIEEVLAAHPDVEEVAIVGAPDEEWGQRIVAAIVPTAGAPGRDEAAWLALAREHVAAHLAPYKRPAQVVLIDELPRNALGKVQKHRIAVS